MVLKIIINNINLFKKSIDAINVLNNDVNFIATKEGISLISTDPSQISLINYIAPKEQFEEYIYNEDVELMFGLHIDSLLQILQHSNNNEKLILEIIENKIKIQLIGDSKRYFELPLIDIYKENLSLPEIKWTNIININSKDIIDTINDSKLFSNFINFKLLDNKLLISSNSSKGNFCQEIILNENQEISIEKSYFNIDFLKLMLKNSENIINISLAKDLPMKIKYNLDKIKIEYILAPRVDID